MSKRNKNLEYIIVGAVILLSIIYIVFKKTDSIHYKIPVLKNIDKGSISKIEMDRAGKHIVIEKKKGEWLVGEGGFKTDPEKIEKIIDAVSTLSLSTLVSRSGNYFKYELDDNRKIKVKVLGGKNILREFDTGKIASTYDHTNVKFPGDKNIYLAKGSIRNEFDKSVDDLRDKKIFVLEKNNIKVIKLIMEGKEYVLNKTILPVLNEKESKEDKDKSPAVKIEWKHDNVKADNSKVKNVISVVSDLICDGFIYTENDPEGTESLFELTLTDGSTKNKISILKSKNKDDIKYSGSTSQSKYKFFIKKYKIDNFLDPLKEIFGIKKKEEQK